MTLSLTAPPARDAAAFLQDNPGRIALIGYEAPGKPRRAVTAGALFAAAAARAADLAVRVPEGARIALAAGNTIAHVEAWLAIQLAGLVWVPINPANGTSANSRALESAKPAVVLADPSGRDALRPLGVAAEPLERRPAARREVCRWRCGDETMAIKFTGGSTGLPKGVVQSCRSVMANRINMDARFPLGPDDVVLASAPLTHGSSHFILPALAAGARLVLTGRLSAAQLAAVMEAESVTTGFMAPTAITRLADVVSARGPAPGALVRLIYGAAPFPPAALDRALAVLGPRIAGLYGQTEAPMTIATVSETELAVPRLRASVGRPAPLSEVVILDPGGREVPQGEEGEIAVSGPLLMQGYLDAPSKTAKAMPDGRLRTGDLGRLGTEGHLFVTGRMSDMIISGGFNIHPAEVENAMVALPGVAEACAVGLPDAEWGERLEALLVAEAGEEPDPGRLCLALRERIGPIKTPKRLVVVAELPRNSLGKLDRAAVRRLLEGHAR